MPTFTRRGVLRGLGLSALAAVGLSSYALVIEPGFRLRVQRYAFTPPGWTAGLKLRIAALSDLHEGEPYMSPARIARIVELMQAQNADLIVLLGDYLTGHRFITRHLAAPEWAGLLGKLSAPLGVHAILGNHDWWQDDAAQDRRGGPTVARGALEAAGIRVLENDAVRLTKDGRPFWLAGLADQLALLPADRTTRDRWRRTKGLDDLAGTLKRVGDDAPIVMLAHEPDIFPKMPARVSVTLCGHTHGGQVRILGWSPIVPSRYGSRYAYGHIVEQGRHLVVSGGLGMSIAPIRFGVPPEIVVLDLG